MIQNVGAFTRNTEFSLLPLQSISVSAIYGTAVFQALFPCVGPPLACIALLIWHTPSLCMCSLYIAYTVLLEYNAKSCSLAALIATVTYTCMHVSSYMQSSMV